MLLLFPSSGILCWEDTRLHSCLSVWDVFLCFSLHINSGFTWHLILPSSSSPCLSLSLLSSTALIFYWAFTLLFQVTTNADVLVNLLKTNSSRGEGIQDKSNAENIIYMDLDDKQAAFKVESKREWKRSVLLTEEASFERQSTLWDIFIFLISYACLQ